MLRSKTHTLTLFFVFEFLCHVLKCSKIIFSSVFGFSLVLQENPFTAHFWLVFWKVAYFCFFARNFPFDVFSGMLERSAFSNTTGNRQKLNFFFSKLRKKNESCGDKDVYFSQIKPNYKPFLRHEWILF